MKQLVLIFILIFGSNTLAENTELSGKYVFYLHGAIIEKGDPKPFHPKYGLYDYPAIVSKLSEYNFRVVSEQRAPDTDHLLYAQKIANQITDLMEKGVMANDITIIGFSKGAMITVIVSSLLKNSDLSYGIIATCGAWYDSEELLKDLRFHGHILSVYEESDIAGSCEFLSKRLPAPTSFTEVSINTGKEHGAFFLPRNEWINPIVSWINRKAANHTGT